MYGTLEQVKDVVDPHDPEVPPRDTHAPTAATQRLPDGTDVQVHVHDPAGGVDVEHCCWIAPDGVSLKRALSAGENEAHASVGAVLHEGSGKITSPVTLSE